MASQSIWSDHYVGTGRQTCSWSVPSGCAADSLTVKYESGTSVYLYWRDGNWKLKSGKSSTYTISGTSGSEVFFAGGEGYCNVSVSISYHSVESGSTITRADNVTLPVNETTAYSVVYLDNKTMSLNNIYHRITWSCGSWSQEIRTATGSNSAQCDIYPSSAYASTQLSYSVTISVRTYRNNTETQVGSTATKAITVTIPSDQSSLPDVIPTIEELQLTPSNQKLSRNLINVTSLHISATEFTTSFNSTIASVSINGGGINESLTAEQILNGVDVYPTAIGSCQFVVTVTDSRGFSHTYNPSPIAYHAYAAPTLTAAAYRCNAQGVQQDDGTYVAVKPTFSYTLFTDGMTPQNAATTSFEYSADGVNYTTISGTSSTSGQIVVLGSEGTFNTSAQYYIRTYVTDTVGSTVYTTNFVGTAAVFMRWDHSKNAFGFGAYPSVNNSVFIHHNWKLYTHGQEILSLIVDTVYPVGSIFMSLDNTKNPNNLFPGTTWESIGGKFLLASDSTYTTGDTGGEATHTLTESELPAIEKTMVLRRLYAEGSQDGYNIHINAGSSGISSEEITANVTSPQVDVGVQQNKAQKVSINIGNGSAHNNMPPYLVVDMWKRTR